MSAAPSIPHVSASAIPPRRTLVPIEAAMVLLDRQQEAVLDLIESGKLAPAWNIAICPNGQREIRVWRDSLLALKGMAPVEKLSLDAVIARVLPLRMPGVKQPIRGVELAMRFCSTRHTVARLLRAGELKSAGKRTGRDSHLIVFESVVNFLKKRVLT
jgi:hypothetical protein